MTLFPNTPLPGNTPPPRKRRVKAPDPIFDTLVELFGYNPDTLTKTDRGVINRAVKDLRVKKATPRGIREVHAWCVARWKGEPFGPMALSKWWDTAIAWVPQRTIQPGQPSQAEQKRIDREFWERQNR